jgi:hypothetical protein
MESDHIVFFVFYMDANNKIQGYGYGVGPGLGVYTTKTNTERYPLATSKCKN